MYKLKYKCEYKETDKLLFEVFNQLFFRNTQLFFNQRVAKSISISRYPIKIVDVVCKIYGQSCVTQYEFAKCKYPMNLTFWE